MAVQRLGDVAVGTIVKIDENGDPVNYIVVQQGSPSNLYYGFENVTLLLRQGIYSNRAWGSNNRYGQSSVHSWLNGTYVNVIDSKIQPYIKTVKIPYAAGANTGDIQTGSNGLSCKAFLLSETEINIAEGNDALGTTLAYFNGANNTKRIAKLGSEAAPWWTRSAASWGGGELEFGEVVYAISKSGSEDSYSCKDSWGVRPAIPLSSDLFVRDDGTVTTNQPPTAPGSIAVTGVVRGENAAITLTAATDPDGTVASYIYERQVDGGAWQQVAQVNSLTQTDTVGEDWGTVAYRACAVDDLGLAGPCITGETYTVNSGWVTIGGPAEDMGRQPRRFDFAFSVSVSGVASVDAITVSVARDGTRIYSGTPGAGEQISVPIDARLLGAGEHVIEVQASKDDYLPASRRYTFTVPAVTIPDGGYGAISQASDGKTMFYTTLAQRCIGTDGVDIQAQVDALTARVKTLEG